MIDHGETRAVPMAAALRPRLLSINLLRACNLRCRFCSESSSPEFLGDHDGQSLSSEQVRDLLSEAAAAGIRWVAFVGGEPTLRRDLPSLVRHARELGIAAGVITNGYRLGSDASFAAALAEAGLYVATFSWYGASDEAAAAATGHQHYRSFSLNGVRAARGAGLRVAFNVVLTSANIASFHDGSAWAELEAHDPEYVFITPLMPAGRAGDRDGGTISEACADLVVEPRAYLAAFAAIRTYRLRARPRYSIRMAQAYVPLSTAAKTYVDSLGDVPFYFQRSQVSCRDVCGTKVEVRWDGQLNACCFYPYSDALAIGNVFDAGGLATLLEQGSTAMATLGDAFTCPNYPAEIDGFGLGCPYRSALDEL